MTKQCSLMLNHIIRFDKEHQILKKKNDFKQVNNIKYRQETNWVRRQKRMIYLKSKWDEAGRAALRDDDKTRKKKTRFLGETLN